MKYLLKPVINIERPLVFLCGPLYEDKKYDRRKILGQYLVKEFTKKVLPVIVDTFLDKGKINDSSIKIPLMEEICAAVSAKTYIFLDTFSAVAELGIFSSAFAINDITVITPVKSDILINNINFFVSEVFNSGTHIYNLSYHPRITRVPKASDYVVEYYEFPYNLIPENVRQDVEKDISLNPSPKSIRISNKSEIPNELSDINYTYSSTSMKIEININLRLLFYLVASIIVDLSITDDEIIKKYVDEIVVNTILKYKPDLSTFSLSKINFGLKTDEITTIRHITKFLNLYKEHSKFTSEQIITKSASIIRSISAIEYFLINSQDLDTMRLYIENPSRYVNIFNLRIGSKSREITRYTEKDGECLRQIHKKIRGKLSSVHTFSDYSYAYRKGFGILDCVKRHCESSSFLVIDIHKFFNSITFGQLYKILKDKFQNSFETSKEFELIVKCLLFENQLSLGFITSPLISDIFLNNFDATLVKSLQDNKVCVVYTRYADDMIFSSKEKIDDDCMNIIIKIVEQELQKLKLTINHKKTRLVNIINIGDHAKLLGLNIVKQKEINKITLGKKYIYDTAKLFLNYLSNVINGLLVDNEKFYMEKIISGRVAFIKQIEGADGYEKLKNRIKYSTNGRVEVDDDRIEFNT